jgi:hypothetical protein
MPMDRALYPADWDALALGVKGHFGWVCQKCRQPMRRPGEPLDTHRRTLTIAHLDHDRHNHTDARLTALCAPCHLRYDNQTLFEPQSDDLLPGVNWTLPFIRIDEVRLNDEYCKVIGPTP